jgi:hypothetical protein
VQRFSEDGHGGTEGRSWAEESTLNDSSRFGPILRPHLSPTTPPISSRAREGMSSHPIEVLCLDSDSDSDLPPPRALPPKPPRPAPPLPRRRVEPPASYQVAAPPRGGWGPGSQPQGAGWSSGDETRRDGPSAGGVGGGDGSARRASRNISDCAGQVSRAGVMELDLCDSSASDEEMEVSPSCDRLARTETDRILWDRSRQLPRSGKDSRASLVLCRVHGESLQQR